RDLWIRSPDRCPAATMGGDHIPEPQEKPVSDVGDDLRNLTPDPDATPVDIELTEERTDDPQVTFYTLFDEYMEHYRQALQGLPAERLAAHEEAWEEIHRTNLVYWEQAKKSGWEPADRPGWETVAAMNDIAMNMANLASKAVDEAASE